MPSCESRNRRYRLDHDDGTNGLMQVLNTREEVYYLP